MNGKDESTPSQGWERRVL